MPVHAEPKRRAMNEQQKEERRRLILEAAWHLLEETSYDAVMMQGVAERAGLAKGTVYLYFRTKEELFLALEGEQLAGWFAEIDKQLPRVAPNSTDAAIDAVVRILGDSLAGRQTLMRLLRISHTILEHNIDEATALRSKQSVGARVSHTGAILETALPFLEPTQGAHVLIQIYALVLGIQQLADPAPIVKAVVQNHHLDLFDINFATEFSHMLRALLSGLAQQSRSQP